MSRVLFDFFNESFLSDEDAIAEDYASWSEDELASELERYRNHVLESREEIDRLSMQAAGPGPAAYVGVAARGS